MALRGNIGIDVRARNFREDIIAQARAAEKGIKPINIRLNDKGFRQPLGRITGDMAEFQKSLDASVARTLSFGAAVAVLSGVARGFKAMVTSAIEVEKQLKDVNVILQLNSSNLRKFSADLFAVAKNTGQTFESVATAATELARQGLGAEETLKRINAAMVLTRLSGMDSARSVETLTAALNGFKKAALDAETVINRLANVDAAFAVSTNDLSDALSRASSTAQAAKVSFNELLAAVTSVQQQTARGGAVIGNAFKSIFTRIQRSSVREQLEAIGVATTTVAGNFRSAMAVLKDYASIYDTLSDAQKAYTDQLIAGVFQINNLRALIIDLKGDFSIYNRALQTANNTTNEAITRNKELNKTTAALMMETINSAKELGSALAKVLAMPAIKKVLDIFNSIASTISKALDPEKGSLIVKSFFGAIGDFIAGPGLLIIAGAFMKLFQFIATQTGKAATEIFRINSKTRETEQIERQINAILSSNTKLYGQILAATGNTAKQEQILLNHLKMETAELQKQQMLIASMARSRGVRGAVLPRGKAQGFIPNYANGLEGAIASERKAIAAGVGGADPKTAKPKVLKNFPVGGGRKETVVANTDEVIIPHYRGSKGSAIFNKDMIAQAGGMPQGARKVSAAMGLIPNYAMLGRSPLALTTGMGRRGQLPMFSQKVTANIAKRTMPGAVGQAEEHIYALLNKAKEYKLSSLSMEQTRAFIPNKFVKQAVKDYNNTNALTGKQALSDSDVLTGTLRQVAAGKRNSVRGDIMEDALRRFAKTPEGQQYLKGQVYSTGGGGRGGASGQYAADAIAEKIALEVKSGEYTDFAVLMKNLRVPGGFPLVNNIAKEIKTSKGFKQLSPNQQKAESAIIDDLVKNHKTEVRKETEKVFAQMAGRDPEFAQRLQELGYYKAEGKNSVMQLLTGGAGGGFIPNFAGLAAQRIFAQSASRRSMLGKLRTAQLEGFSPQQLNNLLAGGGLSARTVPNWLAPETLKRKHKASDEFERWLGARSTIDDRVWAQAQSERGRMDLLNATGRGKFTQTQQKLGRESLSTLITSSKDAKNILDDYLEMKQIYKGLGGGGPKTMVGGQLTEAIVQNIAKFAQVPRKVATMLGLGKKFPSVYDREPLDIPNLQTWSGQKGMKMLFGETGAKKLQGFAAGQGKGFGADIAGTTPHPMMTMAGKVLRGNPDKVTLSGNASRGVADLGSGFSEILRGTQGKQSTVLFSGSGAQLPPDSQTALRDMIGKKFKIDPDKAKLKNWDLTGSYEKFYWSPGKEGLGRAYGDVVSNATWRKQWLAQNPSSARNQAARGFIPNFKAATTWRGISTQKGALGDAPTAKDVFKMRKSDRGTFRASEIASVPDLSHYLMQHAKFASSLVSSSRLQSVAREFAKPRSAAEYGFGTQQGYMSKMTMAEKRIYGPRAVQKTIDFLMKKKGWSEPKAVQWYLRQAMKKPIGFDMPKWIKAGGDDAFMSKAMQKEYGKEQEVALLNKSAFDPSDAKMGAPFAAGFIPNYRRPVRLQKQQAQAVKGVQVRPTEKKKLKEILNWYNTNRAGGLRFDSNTLSFGARNPENLRTFFSTIGSKRNVAAMKAEGISYDKGFINKLALRHSAQQATARSELGGQYQKYRGEIGRSVLTPYFKGDARKSYEAAAGGLIPNYAQEMGALQDAIVREETALKEQGSAARVYVDQDSRLKGSQNPRGLLVANTRDEPAGGSQGVNRALKEGVDPKIYGAVKGFVPNYTIPPGLRKAQIQNIERDIRLGRIDAAKRRVAQLNRENPSMPKLKIEGNPGGSSTDFRVREATVSSQGRGAQAPLPNRQARQAALPKTTQLAGLGWSKTERSGSGGAASKSTLVAKQLSYSSRGDVSRVDDVRDPRTLKPSTTTRTPHATTVVSRLSPEQKAEFSTRESRMETQRAEADTERRRTETRRSINETVRRTYASSPLVRAQMQMNEDGSTTPRSRPSASTSPVKLDKEAQKERVATPKERNEAARMSKKVTPQRIERMGRDVAANNPLVRAQLKRAGGADQPMTSGTPRGARAATGGPQTASASTPRLASRMGATERQELGMRRAELTKRSSLPSGPLFDKKAAKPPGFMSGFRMDADQAQTFRESDDFKKMSEKQQKKFERGQKWGARVNKMGTGVGGFGSMGMMMGGQMLQQQAAQRGERSATGEALGAAGMGAGIGMMFGPKGAIIGAAIGAAWSLAGEAEKNAVAEMEKGIKVRQDSLSAIADQINALQQFGTVADQYSQALKSGDAEATVKSIENLTGAIGLLGDAGNADVGGLLASLGDPKQLNKKMAGLQDSLQREQSVEGMGLAFDAAALTMKKDPEKGAKEMEKAAKDAGKIMGGMIDVKRTQRNAKTIKKISIQSSDDVADMMKLMGLSIADIPPSARASEKAMKEFGEQLKKTAQTKAVTDMVAKAFAGLNKNAKPLQKTLKGVGERMASEVKTMQTAFSSMSKIFSGFANTIMAEADVFSPMGIGEKEKFAAGIDKESREAQAGVEIESLVRNFQAERAKEAELAPTLEKSGDFGKFVKNMGEGEDFNIVAQTMADINAKGFSQLSEEEKNLVNEIQQVNNNLMAQEAIMNAQLDQAKRQRLVETLNGIREANIMTGQRVSEVGQSFKNIKGMDQAGGVKSVAGADFQAKSLQTIVGNLKQFAVPDDPALMKLQGKLEESQEIANFGNMVSTLTGDTSVLSDQFDSADQAMSAFKTRLQEFLALGRDAGGNEITGEERETGEAILRTLQAREDLKAETGRGGMRDLAFESMRNAMQGAGFQTGAGDNLLALSTEIGKGDAAIVSGLSNILGVNQDMLSVLQQQKGVREGIEESNRISQENQKEQEKSGIDGDKLSKEISRIMSQAGDDMGAAMAAMLESRVVTAAADNASNAAGFVPNLAPSPVSQAVETEKRMGGRKPVLDYHARVGPYVRDEATQKNFASVVRDHPEGISKATAVSKRMQGAMGAGFIPNFKKKGRPKGGMKKMNAKMAHLRKWAEIRNAADAENESIKAGKDNFWKPQNLQKALDKAGADLSFDDLGWALNNVNPISQAFGKDGGQIMWGKSPYFTTPGAVAKHKNIMDPVMQKLSFAETAKVDAEKFGLSSLLPKFPGLLQGAMGASMAEELVGAGIGGALEMGPNSRAQLAWQAMKVKGPVANTLQLEQTWGANKRLQIGPKEEFGRFDIEQAKKQMADSKHIQEALEKLKAKGGQGTLEELRKGLVLELDPDTIASQMWGSVAEEVKKKYSTYADENPKGVGEYKGEALKKFAARVTGASLQGADDRKFITNTFPELLGKIYEDTPEAITEAQDNAKKTAGVIKTADGKEINLNEVLNVASLRDYWRSVEGNIQMAEKLKNTSWEKWSANPFTPNEDGVGLKHWGEKQGWFLNTTWQTPPHSLLSEAVDEIRAQAKSLTPGHPQLTDDYAKTYKYAGANLKSMGRIANALAGPIKEKYEDLDIPGAKSYFAPYTRKSGADGLGDLFEDWGYRDSDKRTSGMVGAFRREMKGAGMWLQGKGGTYDHGDGSKLAQDTFDDWLILGNLENAAVGPADAVSARKKSDLGSLQESIENYNSKLKEANKEQQETYGSGPPTDFAGFRPTALSGLSNYPVQETAKFAQELIKQGSFGMAAPLPDILKAYKEAAKRRLEWREEQLAGLRDRIGGDDEVRRGRQGALINQIKAMNLVGKDVIKAIDKGIVVPGAPKVDAKVAAQAAKDKREGVNSARDRHYNRLRHQLQAFPAPGRKVPLLTAYSDFLKDKITPKPNEGQFNAQLQRAAFAASFGYDEKDERGFKYQLKSAAGLLGGRMNPDKVRALINGWKAIQNSQVWVPVALKANVAAGADANAFAGANSMMFKAPAFGGDAAEIERFIAMTRDATQKAKTKPLKGRLNLKAQQADAARKRARRNKDLLLVKKGKMSKEDYCQRHPEDKFVCGAVRKKELGKPGIKGLAQEAAEAREKLRGKGQFAMQQKKSAGVNAIMKALQEDNVWESRRRAIAGNDTAALDLRGFFKMDPTSQGFEEIIARTENNSLGNWINSLSPQQLETVIQNYVRNPAIAEYKSPIRMDGNSNMLSPGFKEAAARTVQGVIQQFNDGMLTGDDVERLSGIAPGDLGAIFPETIPADRLAAMGDAPGWLTPSPYKPPFDPNKMRAQINNVIQKGVAGDKRVKAGDAPDEIDWLNFRDPAEAKEAAEKAAAGAQEDQARIRANMFGFKRANLQLTPTDMAWLAVEAGAGKIKKVFQRNALGMGGQVDVPEITDPAWSASSDPLIAYLQSKFGMSVEREFGGKILDRGSAVSLENDILRLSQKEEKIEALKAVLNKYRDVEVAGVGKKGAATTQGKAKELTPEGLGFRGDWDTLSKLYNTFPVYGKIATAEGINLFSKDYTLKGLSDSIGFFSGGKRDFYGDEGMADLAGKIGGKYDAKSNKEYIAAKKAKEARDQRHAEGEKSAAGKRIEGLLGVFKGFGRNYQKAFKETHGDTVDTLGMKVDNWTHPATNKSEEIEWPALLEALGNLSEGYQTIQNVGAQSFSQTWSQLDKAYENILTDLRGYADTDFGLFDFSPSRFTMAKGFVPNFSKLSEVGAAAAAGYKSPVSRGQVRNINIPGVGKSTYNTQETVQHMGGLKQPFIIPPRDSRVAKSYAGAVQSKFGFNPYSSANASGFIPNFAANEDVTRKQLEASKLQMQAATNLDDTSKLISAAGNELKLSATGMQQATQALQGVVQELNNNLTGGTPTQMSPVPLETTSVTLDAGTVGEDIAQTVGSTITNSITNAFRSVTPTVEGKVSFGDLNINLPNLIPTITGAVENAIQQAMSADATILNTIKQAFTDKMQEFIQGLGLR